MGFGATIKVHLTKTKKMKKITTKSIKSLFITVPRRLVLATIAVSLVVGGSFPAVRDTVLADDCHTIADCQWQIANNNNSIAELKNQAISFQDAVDRLNGQIGALQAQIDASTAEQRSLQQQIEEGQAKLDKQREYLGQSVKGMYVKGELTTVEMLATSKNISDFVDGETYRAAVQTKIQKTVQSITKLQNELKVKKTKIEELLAQQQKQQAELNSARAEQASMLAYNQAQQNAYNAQTSANQARLDDLIAAQRRANSNNLTGSAFFIRFPGAVQSFNTAAYPYANAGFNMSTAPGCGSVGPPYGQRDAYDSWGYCTRQCVSYAAWAVEASGRSAPMYYGHAKNWIYAADNAGIPVYTSNPKVGDVLITTGGTWGHAMYVVEVGAGQVRVAEYNANLTGAYRADRWITY